MKFIRDLKAISKLLLILLLLLAMIVGAILSYIWVMGYFITLESVIPEKTTVSISNVTFFPQNTSYFSVTLLNPSYSPKEAQVTEIVASTGEEIHNITEVSPLLPYRLKKGEEETFECKWTWANYTGETAKIIAFIADGSGPTFETETPLVELKVTDIRFNSSLGVTHFNMTVHNSASSVTHVNITDIEVAEERLRSGDIVPSLPIRLDPDSSVALKCNWNWTNYQNTSVTVAVRTLQGYVNYTTKVTPLPVTLEIIDVDFSPTNTIRFNVTIRNDGGSPTHVDIKAMTVTMENGTVQEIDGTKVLPQIHPSPYPLNPNATETFKCPWNWIRYWGRNVTITVNTLQDFSMQYAVTTPSPINITNVVFDPALTNQFNVTVDNSEFHPTNVNIGDITLTVENETFQISGTEVQPFPLPHSLSPNSNITFVCPWNWTNYQGKRVTVIVRSIENYSTQFTKVTSKRVILAIASILFDPVDTTGFNVTVRNSDSSLEDAYLSTVTVTLEKETIKTISFSYTLSPNSTVTIPCSWDWTDYRGNNITITVHATKGYETSTLYTAPPEF